MDRRLYAGNLNFEITDPVLREVFARAGGVKCVEIVKDRRTGRSKGFGFVDMMTAEDAQAAVVELDGTEVMGRTLRVALAKPRDADRHPHAIGTRNSGEDSFAAPAVDGGKPAQARTA
jgi:RNA recognition motif-containing protein